MSLALAVFLFAYLDLSQWADPNTIGGDLFVVLSCFGIFYCLLAGPLATVDCLGRERREGTLGLLFLTDLRSRDVVFGKMASSSLDMLLGFTAILPLAALPFLLGGVTLKHFGLVVVGLGNILFLSLAAGACTSSLFASSRASLGLALVFLLFLSAGVPMAGEALNIMFDSPVGAWFYMVCPLSHLRFCTDLPTLKMWHFCLNILGTQALAWACLGIACRQTGRTWQDLPASARALRWRERWERWHKGPSGSRLAWRRFMLDKNPVSWLEGRGWLQPRVLWTLILGSLVYWVVANQYAPQKLPDDTDIVFWPLWAHYILCVWIAIQAPRRLADDKQSGALELLVCTPLQPREILAGIMRMMRRRFGSALLGLLALDAFIACAFFNVRGGWNGFLKDKDDRLMAICAVIVFPVQAYSLARVGLYQGLAQGNSLRATFRLIWKLCLLPWMVFLLFILACALGGRHFRFLARIFSSGPDWVMFGAWAAIHVLLCALFLTRANWQLRRNFRRLAAQSARVSWWNGLRRAWQAWLLDHR